MNPKQKKLILAVGIVIALIISISVQPFTYENIDAGNVGIKINLYGSDKGVDNVALVTGRVWYNTWTTKIIEFPTFVQQADYEPFVMTTKDAAEFKVDPKLNYKLNDVDVPKIYRQYRRPLAEIQQGFLKTTLQDAYRMVGNSFTSDSIMSNRGLFEDAVQNMLIKTLSRDGFKLEQLTSALTPPASLRQMIDEKNESIQARLKADNQAKQAESEAKVKIATAQGEAQSTLIKARAEAEANRLKQSALTPMLIQQQWIDKWSGELPTYMLGSNTTTMIGLPK
jgi:regulator of protease activity HflC (stomatin/prohibitin superfamily)